jgi:hypothetical protein
MWRLRANTRFLFLILSWLAGTGALNLGLLRERVSVVAIATFLVALGLWLVARSISPMSRAMKVASNVLIAFWIFALAFAAAVGKASVYKTPFFGTAVGGIVIVVVLAWMRWPKSEAPVRGNRQ